MKPRSLSPIEKRTMRWLGRFLRTYEFINEINLDFNSMTSKNVRTLVPKDILENIRKVISDSYIDEDTGEYYDDIEDVEREIQDCIDSEVHSYIKVMNIDFENFYMDKKEFIKEYEGLDACGFEDCKVWGYIYEDVKENLEDYKKFDEYEDYSIEHEVVAIFKSNILEKLLDGYYYSSLYEALIDRIEEYNKVIEIRKEISPYKSLLIELEELVGNECYNKNIQNYSSWGEFAGEGRGFRYPVTLSSNHKSKKLKEIPDSTPGEELIAGYYAFGANELNIYRALFKVVKRLEEKYGLDI